MEIVMKNLIGLQSCDLMIKRIHDKKEKWPVKVRNLENRLKTEENRLEEELNHLELFKREKKEMELEVESLEGRIEKSNIKLSAIKSNKEYQAALKEIEDLEREKALHEDKVLEMMENIEGLDETYVESKADTSKLKDEIQKEHNKVIKEIKALDKELKIHEKERTLLCKSIDAGLLKKYDKIKEYRGGFAVSRVIKGVCGGCNMGMPPQKFNELICGDKIMTCPNCHRIIYWGEDERLKDDVDQSGMSE